MTMKLSIRNLTRRFGNRTILHDFSLDVEEGSSIAITGPSGSGKSTLLNMIGLLDAPTEGTIDLDGSPLPPINSGAATRLRRNAINYLFQSYALITDMTALDNVLLGMTYAPGTRTAKRRQARAMLAQVGLAHVMGDKAMTLSGGEQQRVAMARALLKPGDLILADEPTGALDHDLAQRVFHDLLTLQREYRRTLIVVTHDPTIASQCDRTIRLEPEEPA